MEYPSGKGVVQLLQGAQNRLIPFGKTVLHPVEPGVFSVAKIGGHVGVAIAPPLRLHQGFTFCKLKARDICLGKVHDQ
jgi:hypothetical protein